MSKSVEQYLIEVRRLKGRFPALKRFVRRKTLKPHEKAQITRARNVANIMEMAKSERPDRYENYKFPADRQKSQAYYRRVVRELSPFDDTMKKYRSQRKKFTAAQKAVISKKRAALPGTDNLFPLTKDQAKKLPADVVRSRGGPRAIKLRNVSPKAKISVNRNGDLIVKQSGRRWVYVHTGPKIDVMAHEAERIFNEEDPQAIYVWTVHGRTGEGFGDIESLVYKLENDYFKYLTQAQINDNDWLIGLAYFR